MLYLRNYLFSILSISLFLAGSCARSFPDEVNATAYLLSLADSSSGSSSATASYTIGGTITGLSGGNLTLQNNGGDDLTIASGATSFTFPVGVADGGAYDVTVLTSPTGPVQTCTVVGGNGTVSGANVTNIQITCSTSSFTVGGTITGLTGSGLVIQNNSGDDLSLGSGTTSFTFATSVADGSSYNVQVLTNPTTPALTCTASNNSGTLSGASITDILITCSSVTYTIGGSISGLSGHNFTIQNNSGDDRTLASGDTSFTFSTAVADGSNYSVTVFTDPVTPAQTCIVTGGSGTVSGANITGVSISCTADLFYVSGTISGLSAGSLTLELNSGLDATTVTGGATAFNFATGISDLNSYSVTVLSQPAGMYCAVTGGSGTIFSSDITNVAVDCSLVPAGGYDITFDGDGIVEIYNGTGDVTKLRIEYGSDDMLHVVGYGDDIAGGGDNDSMVCRFLSSSGVTDFCLYWDKVGVSAGTEMALQSMAVDAGNRILFGGYINHGADVDGLLGALDNGVPDGTFAAGNGYMYLDDPGADGNTDKDYITTVTLDDSVTPNRIVIAGTTVDGASNVLVTVYRFDENGNLDMANFNSGSGFLVSTVPVVSNGIKAAVVDRDGNIYVAGRDGTDAVIVKILESGALDTSFGTAGVFTYANGDIENARRGPDDKLYFVGTDNGTDGLIIRLNADGSLDNSFDSDGSLIFEAGGDEFLYDLAIDAQGNILATGYTNVGGSDDLLVARFLSGGVLDTTFASPNGYFYHDALLVGGNMERGQGITLGTDGSIFVSGIADDGTNYSGVILKFQ